MTKVEQQKNYHIMSYFLYVLYLIYTPNIYSFLLKNEINFTIFDIYLKTNIQKCNKYFVYLHVI